MQHFAPLRDCDSGYSSCEVIRLGPDSIAQAEPCREFQIHVVDVSRGMVAAGMRVELFAVAEQAPELRLLKKSMIDDGGDEA